MGFTDRGAPIAVATGFQQEVGYSSAYPLEVYLVGGGSKYTGTFTDNDAHEILPAPGEELLRAYALKRIVWNGTGIGASAQAILFGGGSGAIYSCVVGPGSDDLDGVLAPESLSIQCEAGSATFGVSLFYDNVITPTML